MIIIRWTFQLFLSLHLNDNITIVCVVVNITLDKQLSSQVRKVKSGLERIFGKSEKEVRLSL